MSTNSFHDAAEAEDLVKVKALFEENPGFANGEDKEDLEGLTSLHGAAIFEHRGVELWDLIEQGYVENDDQVIFLHTGGGPGLFRE